MSAPSVLVMDLGGVTCRWEPERRLVALSALSGLPPSTIDQAVFESGFDEAGERGRFDLGEFTATLRDLLGISPGPGVDDELRRCWAEAFDPNPAVLKAIAGAGVRTALFTNNGPLLEAGLAVERSDVGAVFDQLVFSWRLGATKPDAQAFVAATAALDVDPDEVLFVDDSEANVAAAIDAGWRAHRFTTTLDLQAALRAHGLGRR